MGRLVYNYSFSLLSLLFASTKLFLLILVLFHFLNSFTASFFSCLNSLSHHSFFFLVSFAPFTLLPFLSLLFQIFISVIPPSSLLLALAFSSPLLYSSSPWSSHIYIVTFICFSFALPFPFSSWFVSYTYF
jgi:hypothetical protein